MTDLWKEAVALIRETAKQMHGKKTQEYVGDDGTRVNGWTLHRYPSHHNEKRFSNAIGDWEETWGDHELVLGNDGKIYEWRRDSHEYGEARSGGYRIERSQRVQPCSRQRLLGTGQGKPFATLTTWLQRLPYS